MSALNAGRSWLWQVPSHLDTSNMSLLRVARYLRAACALPPPATALQPAALRCAARRRPAAALLHLRSLAAHRLPSLLPARSIYAALWRPICCTAPGHLAALGCLTRSRLFRESVCACRGRQQRQQLLRLPLPRQDAPGAMRRSAAPCRPPQDGRRHWWPPGSSRAGRPPAQGRRLHGLAVTCPSPLLPLLTRRMVV